ncbi:MAG: nitroreductase family protein [Planctomycetota bacterium]
MDTLKTIDHRRSVRQFKPDPVGREILERIVRAGIEAPSGCNMQLRQYLIVDDPGTMEQIRPVSGALAGAPAAVVLLVDPQETQFGAFWVQDASAAMENMLLAAVALGYAGCWVEGALRRSEDKLRDVLGVPDDLRVWSLTPIGRAQATPARPEKSDPAEVTHYNRFGAGR